MLTHLGKPITLVTSFVLVVVMFLIVMFYVNPMIDGGDGSGLLKLQLSFSKENGEAIVNGWGESGVRNFREWIFTDYIYAFTYSLFLASLFSFLALKNTARLKYENLIVLFSFSAGGLDCIENTMELFFINNPSGFSNELFLLHSVIASLKWFFVAVLFLHIIYLIIKNTFIFLKNR